MAGITYKQYVATMQNMLVEGANDQAFFDLLPRMIEYAELRIYRENDFLYTRTTNTAAMTASSRNLTVPANIIIVEEVNVVTPSTETDPDLGTRNPLMRVTLDWLNMCYPTAAATSGSPSVPQYYAMLSNTAIRVAPAPSAAFTTEVVGIYRPELLGPNNETDFISTNMPDLLIAASMVFGAGYQRDFGAQSEDPKMAQSWENQYQTLKAGVNLEELRRKSEAWAWTPYTPSPVAN